MATKVIFICSILLAFLFPQFSSNLQFLLVPVLLIMMTVSMKDMAIKHVRLDKTIINLIIINYVILTGLYIILAGFFIQDDLHRYGFAILGMMPPAVGIITLSFILKGDMKESFIAELICYGLSIVLIPLIGYFVFGNSISPIKIIEVLIYVIVIPFILSRVLHKIELKKHVHVSKKITRTIINLCYGLTFYIIIGINRDSFLTDFHLAIPIFILLIMLKFGTGTALYLLLKRKIKKKIDVLYVLFGTMKNGGAATAISFLLFGVEGTFPLAVHAIIVPAYIIYLEWIVLEKFR